MYLITLVPRRTSKGMGHVADSRAMPDAPLARMRSVVLDCPDPRALADFYKGVLGGDVASIEDDWVVLVVDALRLAFHRADDFAPPTWPTGERPQQFHLDVTVDDVDAIEPQVLALGAVKHEVQPGEAEGDQF